jgi:hypothetical protein
MQTLGEIKWLIFIAKTDEFITTDFLENNHQMKEEGGCFLGILLRGRKKE